MSNSRVHPSGGARPPRGAGMNRMMSSRTRGSAASERVFGWLGMILLFAILPIKLFRFVHHGAGTLVIGIAPSILGPAGLLFLLLSSSGRVSRWSLRQVALIVAVVAVALEFAQLIPRHGILARARYTFDYGDLFASVASVAFAYVIAAAILRKLGAAGGGS
jgi:hypothetical protein